MKDFLETFQQIMPLPSKVLELEGGVRICHADVLPFSVFCFFPHKPGSSFWQ